MNSAYNKKGDEEFTSQQDILFPKVFDVDGMRVFIYWKLPHPVEKLYPYVDYLNSAALFLVRYFYILKWHFWDLSIDMGIFWGSWFLHNHEIPHPSQWGM